MDWRWACTGPGQARPGQALECGMKGRAETYPDPVHVLHAHIAKVEHIGRRPRGRLRGPLRHRGRVDWLPTKVGPRHG